MLVLIDRDSGMSRRFRDWRPDQSWLFPPSPQDWLPENHLVYFLMEVSRKIDTSLIVGDDDSDRGGQPPSCAASRSQLIPA